MVRYHKQTRILVALDCIIFGFDGANLKLLLVQRGLEYEKGKWIEYTEIDLRSPDKKTKREKNKN